MKILHIATGFSLNFAGGITNYLRELADLQVAQGHQVEILSGPDSQSKAPASSVVVHELRGQGYPFTLRLKRRNLASGQAIRIINEGRYDIVHFHMVFGLGAEIFGQLGAVPYVVTLHDYTYICPRSFMIDVHGRICRTIDLDRCSKCVGLLDQVDWLMRAGRRLNVTLPRIKSSATTHRLETMRDFLHKAALLLPVSNRVSAIYAEVAPKGRYKTLFLGSASAENRDYEKLPSDKIRLTFIGVLNERKGAKLLERVLLACRERIDCEFHFYGRSEDGWAQRLTRLGLINHGTYRPEQLPDIMKRTDLGLVLSIWEETGPLVAMEFINYGTPVFGTTMGGMPDFVRSGTGYLFDPYSEVNVRQALAWLHDVDRITIHQMMEQIRPLMTPKSHVALLTQYYSQALNRYA